MSRGRRSIRDCDLNRLSQFTTGEQLRGPKGVPAYSQSGSHHDERDAGSMSEDGKASGDELCLGLTQPNDSAESLPQSYVATPDGYEDSTENIIGLARSTPPKRHASHYHPISRRQSLVERLRVYSADWAPKAGLKRESLRLSPLPSLPYAGYIYQQSLEDQSHATMPTTGPVVGSIGGFDFPKPPSTPVHLSDSRPPPSDLVTWNGKWDPDDPLNRSTARKTTSTMALLAMAFCAGFASSTLAAARTSAAQMFETSDEIVILASALTVFGIAIGAPLWASISSLCGRKGTLLAAFVVFIIFNVPVGLAKDLETLLAFRFFLGVFGAAPIAVVPLCLADVWRPAARGTALSFFSAVCIIGPIIGTVASGCLTVDPNLSWRWTALIAVGLSILCGIFAAFVYYESSPSILLGRKARMLRLVTNDWALHTQADEDNLRTRHCITTTLRMFTQPAFLLPSLHMSFAYGVLCKYQCGINRRRAQTTNILPDLLFMPYEDSFHSQRGWSLVLDLLTLLPVAVGTLIGVFINWIICRKQFATTNRAQRTPPPEARLIPMIVGAWALPIGLLVFGWTSTPRIFFVPELMAGVPTGVGKHYPKPTCAH